MHAVVLTARDAGLAVPLADGSSGTDRATLIAAIIAGAVALVGAGIALWGNVLTGKVARADAVREYTLRQLNDFYGPIYMRRQLSNRLHNQVMPPLQPPVPGTEPPAQWRLVDHIVEIKADTGGRRQAAVEEILAINDELTELIIGRGGLVISFPPPPVLDEFLEHASTLSFLWQHGQNATDETYKPFPNALDTYIAECTATLRKRLQ